MNRTPVRLFILTLTTALAALVLPGSAQAAPYCGITWGSTPKTQDRFDLEAVNDVRAGRHACFDRLVVDVGGEDAFFGSYDVRYVREVREDGSGARVPVRGGAVLQVVVKAPAYNEHGATYVPRNRAEVVDVTGFSTFRQVAWAGSFEGQTTVGLGVRAVLPFRVFTLPGRVVVDVAHTW